MRERLILSSAALAFFLAALAAALAAAEQAFQLRGYEDATRQADLPYRQPLLGVNGDWLGSDREKRATEWQILREANITWLRQPFDWGQMEMTRHQTDWAAADEFAQALREQSGLRPVAWLIGRPDWLAPADDPAELARFAAAFAQRYGDVFDHYQIGASPAEPRHYAATLSAVYPAIHAADPAAEIWSAPLDFPADQVALAALYQSDTRQFWDSLTASALLTNPPKQRQMDDEIANFSSLARIRETMRDNGDGRGALFLTELDWPTAPAAEKSRYILAALARADREWPWLGAIFLPISALADPDLRIALREATTAPGEATTAPLKAPANGLYSMRHPAARYTGEWSFQGDTADHGRAGDSELSFTFHGRDIALLLREDAWHTVLFASIDGRAPNQLPPAGKDQGRIILTSADRQPQRGLTALARNLPAGEHELRLLGAGGDTRFPLLGIAVSSGNLAAPYQRQLAWAGLMMALSAAVCAGYALPMLRRRWRSFRQFRVKLRAISVGDAAERQPTQREFFAGAMLALIAYAVLQAQLAPALTLAASAVLFVIILWQREIGLALILLALPFQRLTIAIAGWQFPPAELLLALTLAAEMAAAIWRGRRWLTERITAHYRWQDALVILWVALGALSLLWTRWPGPAQTEWRAAVLEPALFYALLRWHSHSLSARKRLIAALLLGAGIAAALGIGQLLSGALFVSAEGGARRLLGVFGSPNHAALYLGRCLPFALALALAASEKRLRLLTAVMSALLILAILLTKSFAALLLGLPASLLFVVAFSGHPRRGPLVGGILAMLLLAILLGGRLNLWWNWAEGSLFTRAQVWQSALAMVADEPLLGFGLDQFLYAYRDTYIGADAWRDPDLSHPHQLLLDIWLRLGLAGLALFVAIQWRFWLRVWPALRQIRGSGWRHCESLAIAGAMIYLLAHGLADQSVFPQDLAFYFALLLAWAQPGNRQTGAGKSARLRQMSENS